MVRWWAALLLCAVGSSGCFGESFHATPCKPSGTPTHGTVHLHLVWREGSSTVDPAGSCVVLRQGEDVLAAARLDAAGNATLALPESGDFYAYWVKPDPNDDLCGYSASVNVHVPGPTDLTMEAGKICA